MSDPIKRSDHRIAALALFAALSGAFALTADEAHSQQEITIELKGDNGTTSTDSGSTTFNLAQCQANVGATLEFELGFLVSNFPLANAPKYAVKLDPTNSCDTRTLEIGDNEDGCEHLDNTPTEIPSGTARNDSAGNARYFVDLEVTFSKLFPEITTASGCEEVNLSNRFVVVGEGIVVDDVDQSQTEVTFNEPHQVIVLTQRPDFTPPTPTVTAGESALALSFTAVADAQRYNVYLSESAVAVNTSPEDLVASGGVRLGSVDSSGDTVDISGRNLTLGQTFHIALSGVDGAGNESLLGASGSFQAIQTQGYPERYAESGGRETGGFIFSGCGVSQERHRPAGLLGGLALAILALLLAAGIRRRRAAALWLVAAVTSALVLSMGPAQAQAQDRLDTVGVFELKLGGYLPSIDDEFGGSARPYNDVFGSSTLLLTEIEIDRQIYRGLGTFALAFSGGFMEATGFEVLDDGSRSIDEASLNVLTMRLSAVYRFDVLAVEFDLPFVPTAKLGLDYFIWWTRNSKGEIEQSGKFVGRGDTLGSDFSLGLNLLLDWFDEVSADTLMADYGLANTYLFGEWVFSQVDDFGSATSHDLSDPNGFFFGIAFEY